MSDATREQMAAAFKSAGLIVNACQTQCLADLMWEGKLTGTTYDDINPPRAVALVAVGPCESLSMEIPAQNRDGSHVVGDDGEFVMEVDPESHTIGVIGEDGRCWTIVRAGITWPVDDA